MTYMDSFEYTGNKIYFGPNFRVLIEKGNKNIFLWRSSVDHSDKYVNY